MEHITDVKQYCVSGKFDIESSFKHDAESREEAGDTEV